MEIQKSTFKDLPAQAAGIVVLGCDLSTQENRDGFINGITDFLKEGKVFDADIKPEDVWANLYETTTTGGRTDLTFELKPEAKVNMGVFAMVRLQMGEPWIEDFLVNYASQYGEIPRGPHAGGAFEALSVGTINGIPVTDDTFIDD